jgi:predicted extracellular nuclease
MVFFSIGRNRRVRSVVSVTALVLVGLLLGASPSAVQAQTACGSAFTPIYQIQGSGMTAAITGNVTTEGVVVGDYEGASPALRGFFIQDPSGDGNEATSDGIFIFESNNANTVALGDRVRVTGTAGENQGQTQITSSSIVKCGTGSVSPTDVTLPFPSADYPERYEGMLVRLPQTLYVTEHYQLGRFDMVVMSSGGRLMQPTNVVAPGAPAQARQAANDLNRLIIDDALNNQNPDPILFGRGGNILTASNTLRGGDTATGIVGVMTYTWAGNSASGNAYRVRPVNALGGGVPNFAPTNPRPTAPVAVGGTLRVVSMNLLNYFNTFDGLPDTVDNCTNGVGGTATDCRGADTQAEFDRQWPKTVAAIVAMNPDVLAVNEIENDGYGEASAIQDLVTKLNEATAPGTFAFIDADARTGQVNALGTDAIKVGMIYKPAKVTPLGTAVLNTVAFVNGGDSAPRSRPSLAQAFEQISTGARFVVDANHLKSKGSACDTPDAGDGQGNCNTVRTNAAKELLAWLATDPTHSGDPDVLIIGDLNSYAMEDPVTVLKNGGYTNLIDKFIGENAYSYVFDGQWGYLDNALGSASLTKQVTGVTEYHINADEPSVLDYNTDFKTSNLQNVLYAPDQYRVSDHDPVILGLDLDGTPPTLDVTVTPSELWPADHKYVTVKATVTAKDNRDPHPTVTLVSVTSSELDNGLGDGDQSNDIVKVDAYTFNLRAERSATGPGRVYTITYKATDEFGNSTVKSAKVTVPHDKRN